MNLDDAALARAVLDAATPPRWLEDRPELGILLVAGCRLVIDAIDTDRLLLRVLPRDAHVGQVRGDDTLHYVPKRWHRYAALPVVDRFATHAAAVASRILADHAQPLALCPADDLVLHAGLTLGTYSAIGLEYDWLFGEADEDSESHFDSDLGSPFREQQTMLGRAIWQERRCMELLDGRQPSRPFNPFYSSADVRAYRPSRWFEPY